MKAIIDIIIRPTRKIVNTLFLSVKSFFRDIKMNMVSPKIYPKNGKKVALIIAMMNYIIELIIE
jgi:hypothetical protein